jgi:hypothetical protein
MKVLYVLKCPKTFQVRYVGEGSPDRPYSHLRLIKLGRTTASPRLTKWIKSLVDDGLEPIVEVLRTDLTKTEAVDLEAGLIDQYGRSHLDEGGTLLNVAKRGTVYDKAGKLNPFFGKTHSPETLEKMRLAKVGKDRGETFSETMRLVAKNRPPQSQETRDRRRASMLLSWERKRQSSGDVPDQPSVA